MKAHNGFVGSIKGVDIYVENDKVIMGEDTSSPFLVIDPDVAEIMQGTDYVERLVMDWFRRQHEST